jgi:hypothetical protein
MGIFSKFIEIQRKKREESESSVDWKEMPSGIKFYSLHPVREGANRITIDVLQNGDSVDIRMHGLEDVNVCLASFLTKGVSYAQEKYNEYQANKDTDAIVEEPKAETKPRRERIASPTQRDIDEMRAWAKAKQAKRESK